MDKNKTIQNRILSEVEKLASSFTTRFYDILMKFEGDEEFMSKCLSTFARVFEKKTKYKLEFNFSSAGLFSYLIQIENNTNYPGYSDSKQKPYVAVLSPHGDIISRKFLKYPVETWRYGWSFTTTALVPAYRVFEVRISVAYSSRRAYPRYYYIAVLPDGSLTKLTKAQAIKYLIQNELPADIERLSRVIPYQDDETIVLIERLNAEQKIMEQ